jgi:hypothetical protein
MWYEQGHCPLLKQALLHMHQSQHFLHQQHCCSVRVDLWAAILLLHEAGKQHAGWRLFRHCMAADNASDEQLPAAAYLSHFEP